MSKRTNLRTPAAFPMKAIIICDDFAFAANAASTLTRVGRQAGVNVRWTTKSWPMNALNESALAEQALVEASDAHLIVFPEHEAKSLSFWVFDWLSRWAAVRTIQDAALGVIRVGTGAPATALSELSTFARKYGLNLIVEDGPPARRPMRLSVHFRAEGEVALPIAPTGLVGMRVSYRGFGINE